MKNGEILFCCIFCMLVGFFVGGTIGIKKTSMDYEPIIERWKVVADKRMVMIDDYQLLLEKQTERHVECRSTLREVLDTFDYTQPRPITIED